MQHAPYGSWISPLDAADLVTDRVRLGSPALDRGVAYWSQTRSDEGGRTSVWCLDGTELRELTPEVNVGSSVHEYGGRPWAVRDGVLVYSVEPSRQVWALDVASGRRWALTPHDERRRYADFDICVGRDVVVCVREDHTESDLDCTNTLVALSLVESGPGRVLVEGADFYSSPRVSSGGVLAWVEWDHPNMPWDATRLMRAPLVDGTPGTPPSPDQASGTTGTPVQVAGTPSAPCYPAWRGEELIYLDDESGFWNVHAATAQGVRPLHHEDADFCGPAWVFGTAFALVGDDIAVVRYRDGRGEPGLLHDGVFTPLSDRTLVDASVAAEGEDALWLLAHTDRPTTLERGVRSLTPVLPPEASPLPEGYVARAESVRWQGEAGEVQAFYYAPTNPDAVAPDGTLPPLRLLSHGGPTGSAWAGFNPWIQYWTTRGWAVLDVNYSGSSLFGRAYRERLQGRWGELDVSDCADGVRCLAGRGLIDPRHVAIEGGSAGGFTTLAALTSSDAFAAGNSLYGIGDLEALARDTHKFESHYLFGLVGGTPEDAPELYAERSPINHLDALAVPMLIQQGSEDRVVPPNQAHAMADAVRAKGLPVALLIFEGEGHGFRRGENQVRSLEAAASFFGQVFGFDVPGVPVLPIENLDARPR